MSLVARSPVQFAVVREDSAIECALAREHGARSLLLIASGGCTALALAAEPVERRIQLLDPNPAQLAHVRDKASRLLHADLAQFGVGASSQVGDRLHECGNFERLFRALRQLLDVFVVSHAERERRLRNDLAWDDVFAADYWPVVFELAFADPMLVTMFGPAAVQHATPGSYPGYFRSRIEAGLERPDRASNPYLHHLLLGNYFEDEVAWPDYLRWTRAIGPERRATLEDLADGALCCTLLDVPDFAGYDFVQLSNVLDWMDDSDCERLARRLAAELPPGAVVVWRQLNDPRNLRGLFAHGFDFDSGRDAELLARERSMFYDAVHVGVRR